MTKCTLISSENACVNRILNAIKIGFRKRTAYWNVMWQRISRKFLIFSYLCVGKSAVGFNSQKTFLSIISSGESTWDNPIKSIALFYILKLSSHIVEQWPTFQYSSFVFMYRVQMEKLSRNKTKKNKTKKTILYLIRLN